MAIYLGSERVRFPLISSSSLPSKDMVDIIDGTIESYYNNRVNRIERSKFDNQLNLTLVSFLNCSYIGSYAFANCDGLTSVNFPNCNYIGDYAFNYCYSLASISLPNCSYIGSYAFYECENLTSVNLIGILSIPILERGCFAFTPIDEQSGSVYVPASLYSSFLTATNWSVISSRIVSV